jgi:hypothetical protein
MSVIGSILTLALIAGLFYLGREKGEVYVSTP